MSPWSSARATASALLGLLLPTRLARPLLNLMGHSLAADSHIGLSWVFCDFIGLGSGARIGHLNLLAVRRLVLREHAKVGRSNVLAGPISILLKQRADIGNRNRVLRAKAGVSSGPAQFRLGELAKITSDHRIDCTQSVQVGAFSTLAGSGSQVWTHGYVHDMVGAGRYRIDGRVVIEGNVYIGSACLLSMGIRIARGVIVGSGTSVAHSLLEPGLYVSAPIRAVGRMAPPQDRTDLKRLADPVLCETVFVKGRP